MMWPCKHLILSGGSNGVAMNQAMMLIQGYRLNGNREYLDAAQGTL